ncbi:MAG: PrsW family glutamic-type intramembrane protease [Acidimicrobiia bacterium]|nr:PrsW family glutamic-type intramembrane protease [Acidimicrobiia bacterium]
MRRYSLPAVFGAATVTATVTTLVVPDPGIILLSVVAVGAPLAVLSLVRVLADPRAEGRSPWLSLVLGAAVVPAFVLILHGVFVVVGYNLVAPIVGPAREFWEQLRADPDLFRILTSGSALLLIIELAVVAPLAEESLKPLAALVRRPRTARDAFILGAAAGTGFAMIENLLYASGWFFGSLEGWLPVAVMRMLGAGLHAFGAGMLAWGYFQLRTGSRGRWRRFWVSCWIALTAHGLWNGSIGVAVVLAASRETGGLRGRYDAYAWGVVLLVLLAVLGVLILAALLLAAKRIGGGANPLQAVARGEAGTRQGIAAWGLVSSACLIPATIVILVYPNVVAL